MFSSLSPLKADWDYSGLTPQPTSSVHEPPAKGTQERGSVREGFAPRVYRSVSGDDFDDHSWWGYPQASGRQRPKMHSTALNTKTFPGTHADGY